MQTDQETIQYAKWDEWNPAIYNKEYYSEITLDGRYLMEWVVESVGISPPVDVALEFGSGPTSSSPSATCQQSRRNSCG